jgi:hypothetical protein
VSAAAVGSAREHRQRLAALISALLAMLLAALDSNVIVTALPRVAADLHGFSDLTWVIMA